MRFQLVWKKKIHIHDELYEQVEEVQKTEKDNKKDEPKVKGAKFVEIYELQLV